MQRRQALTVLFVTVSVLMLASMVGDVHASGLSIDGVNSNVCGTTSCSAALTTTNANDIIIVFGEGFGGGFSGPAPFDTPTDSQNKLTFTLRQAATVTEEWWALAGSPLSSDTITVTESGAPDTALMVWGISGVDIVNPFDPNVSLPASNTESGSSAGVSGVSTSNANDMLVVLTDSPSGVTFSAGSGFTLIGPSGQVQLNAEHMVVSSTQSSITVGMGLSGSAEWEILVDAVQAAAATTTTTSTPPQKFYPVGGEMLPINQALVLLPWLALIAAFSTVSAEILIRRRRRSST